MRIARPFTLALALGTTLTGCGGDDTPTGGTPAATRVTIEMINLAFVAPGGGDDVTIMLGDTIEWVNRDNTQHTATSSSVPSGGASFDSGVLNAGETFQFVPDIRGTWVYFCQRHPTTMRGAQITVQ